MRVKQAFRYELDPNVSQRQALARHVGAARFAYNWGLARSREALERGGRVPSAAELHRAWNRWKREHAPWWREVSKCAPQEAFRDLERAFRNWREGRADFPRWKRKKALGDNTARLTGRIRVPDGRHVSVAPHRSGADQGADGRTPSASSGGQGPHPFGDRFPGGGPLVCEPDL
jgi:putative transposase